MEPVNKVCALETLPQLIVAEIQNHLNSYNLGSITNDYIDCIETLSEKKKEGLFFRSWQQGVKTICHPYPNMVNLGNIRRQSGNAVFICPIKRFGYQRLQRYSGI